jgi:PIN domain nuclease of toxin-antitoxin system
VLVLDTNALFSILSNPNQFGRKTQKLLARSTEIYFSPISVFEISIKEMLGKIKLRHPLGALLKEHDFGSLPLRVEDALETYSLPSLVKHDPFDRLIVATAKSRGATLITSDRKLLALEFDWILDSTM